MFAKRRAHLLPVFDLEYDPRHFLFLQHTARKYAHRYGLPWSEDAENFGARDWPEQGKSAEPSDELATRQRKTLLRLVSALVRMFVETASKSRDRTNMTVGSSDEIDFERVAHNFAQVQQTDSTEQIGAAMAKAVDLR